MGTTKHSEQNHNPKEKGFKLKEYSRLKGHELLSEFDSKTGNHVRAGFAAYRRGRLGITLPAHYDWLWAAAQSGHARALPIPYFAEKKFIRAGGLLDMIAHLLLRLSSILHVFL